MTRVLQVPHEEELNNEHVTSVEKVTIKRFSKRALDLQIIEERGEMHFS